MTIESPYDERTRAKEHRCGDVFHCPEQAVSREKARARILNPVVDVSADMPRIARNAGGRRAAMRTDCASALAENDDGGWSALLAGTVKRNTLMRFRLCVTGRMTLQGRVKCPSRTRCHGVVLNHNHNPCVRVKRTFLRRSGYLRGARNDLHHRHHTVMLPVSLAAGRQVVLRIVRSSEQRRAQE